MQLRNSCQINGIIIDICIITVFTAFSLLLLRGLVAYDYVTWDLSIPHFDAAEYVKWTFRPSNEISAGGSYLFSTYPTFLEAFLTFMTNNVEAAKIMTISPIPISFATLYYSGRKLSLGRLPSAAGAFFYAVCPSSFALLFSPGQQMFYAFLPLTIIFTLLGVQSILKSNKFQVRCVLILSVLYAVSLSFMPQGILLLVPVVLIIVFYSIVKYAENLKHKIKRVILNGSLICIVSFLLLLPFSVSFLLPYFSFLSSGKFVNDPFQPTRNVLYQDTKIYNTIRLTGIGDYHIEEPGYNDLKNPINILGLLVCSSIVIAPLVILYKDKYRRELLQSTTESPHRFDFLLIVLIILLAGVLIIELGRNGALWRAALKLLVAKSY